MIPVPTANAMLSYFFYDCDHAELADVDLNNVITVADRNDIMLFYTCQGDMNLYHSVSLNHCGEIFIP